MLETYFFRDGQVSCDSLGFVSIPSRRRLRYLEFKGDDCIAQQSVRSLRGILSISQDLAHFGAECINGMVLLGLIGFHFEFHCCAPTGALCSASPSFVIRRKQAQRSFT